MKEDEDFLEAVEADNHGETPEAEQPEAPETEKPKAEETPTEGVTPEVLELTEPAPGQNVPLGALLDERDRRKAEADRAAMLEEQLRRITQSQQQPEEVPDPLEDPEGFRHYMAGEVQKQAINTTLNMSEVMTRQAYGDELVNAAQQWAKQRMQLDPSFQQRLISSPHPYQQVVAEYQRESALQRLGDPTGIDEFLAWKAAQQQLTAPQQQPAPPGTQRTEAPPKSIASAPSAGGVSSEVVPTEDELFDEVMKAK